MSSRELRPFTFLDSAGFPATATPRTPQRFEHSQRLLEDIVRTIYVAKRQEAGDADYGVESVPRWDGGVDRYGVEHKSIWPRLATFIVQTGADPLEFIVAQFANARRDRLPLPNQIMNDAAVLRWRTHCSTQAAELRRRLQWELDSVACKKMQLEMALQWAPDRAMRYALFNTNEVHATALLRYCLAIEYGLSEVAELYHDQALTEYAFQMAAYDTAWGTCIPPLLREEGKEFVARLVA